MSAENALILVIDVALQFLRVSLQNVDFLPCRNLLYVCTSVKESALLNFDAIPLFSCLSVLYSTPSQFSLNCLPRGCISNIPSVSQEVVLSTAAEVLGLMPLIVAATNEEVRSPGMCRVLQASVSTFPILILEDIVRLPWPVSRVVSCFFSCLQIFFDYVETHQPERVRVCRNGVCRRRFAANRECSVQRCPHPWIQDVLGIAAPKDLLPFVYAALGIRGVENPASQFCCYSCSLTWSRDLRRQAGVVIYQATTPPAPRVLGRGAFVLHHLMQEETHAVRELTQSFARNSAISKQRRKRAVICKGRNRGACSTFDLKNALRMQTHILNLMPLLLQDLISSLRQSIASKVCPGIHKTPLLRGGLCTAQLFQPAFLNLASIQKYTNLAKRKKLLLDEGYT